MTETQYYMVLELLKRVANSLELLTMSLDRLEKHHERRP